MQKEWSSTAVETDWRRGARERQLAEEEQREWQTPSTHSSQSTLNSPMPPLPSRPVYQLPPTTPRSYPIPVKDQQELAHLLEHWHTDGIKFSVAMSIPILVSHVFDDDIFLRLPALKALPSQSPKIEAFLNEDAPPSQQQQQQESNDSYELNALQKYWTFICRYFCRRMKLSTTAFVLGVIFVYQYRVSTAQLTAAIRRTPPMERSRRSAPAVIYSANHLFLVAMMLSNKYTEDHPYPNSYWSSHFGIQVEQLNRLEQSFLQHLDHTIFVRKDDFNRWVLCLSRLCHWLPMARRRDTMMDGPVRRNSREDYPMAAGAKSAVREPDCGRGALPPGLGFQPRQNQAADDRRGHWHL